MRKIFFIKLTLFVLVSFLLIFSANFVSADNVSLFSGNSYYLNLESTFQSLNWAGIKISNDLTPLSESQYPFTSLTLNSPVVIEATFPGYNFKDGEHWYVAKTSSNPSEQFNLNYVQNVTPSDLDAYKLFNVSDYPIFYPNYDDISDSPYDTFSSTTDWLMIGGRNMTAFKITLNTGIDYYVLRYFDGTVLRPLFLVDIADATCFGSYSCVGEFMLPVSPTPYNFYSVNKYVAYTYDVYIDGVQTTSFSQTALPYNVTVLVKNLYTGLPAPNVSVMIAEDNGQNLFIPFKLTGYVSHAYSVGRADENGWESFLVAPTVYPSIDNYSIFVAVVDSNGLEISPENLYITSKDTLIRQSKPLSPSRLYDNAKASVNAMSQIGSFLFKWSSDLLRAKKFKIVYETTTHTFTTYNYELSTFSPNPILLKSGAPNVITMEVRTSGIPQQDYFGHFKESDGYLIMNPYTDSSPLSQKERYHTESVPITSEFIITPTSLGMVNSTINYEVLDSNMNFVADLELNISSDLNIQSGEGVFYSNDLLKTITNAMNQLLNSLFYALNF